LFRGAVFVQIPPNIMMGMEIELRCQISARSITARSSQPRQLVAQLAWHRPTHRQHACEPASSQPAASHRGGGGGPSWHSNATTTTTAAQATRDCGAQEGSLGQTGALLLRRSSPSRQLSIAPSLALVPVGSCGPPPRSRHQATPTPPPWWLLDVHGPGGY
jgi:hypothetical protein